MIAQEKKHCRIIQCKRPFNQRISDRYALAAVAAAAAQHDPAEYGYLLGQSQDMTAGRAKASGCNELFAVSYSVFYCAEEGAHRAAEDHYTNKQYDKLYV